MDFRINKKQQDKRFIIAALIVLFLDQAFKFAILKNHGALRLNRNYNSLLGLGANLYLILLLFLIIFIYIKRNSLQKSAGAARFAYALAFGGIIGNSVDMLYYGYIIDYITFAKLFSFNFSDIAIFIGASILGWKVLEK
jgi:signal peptidase II